MKNIFKITSIGLLAMSLVTSCSLDEVNNSAVTDVNYITSETQYEELVAAAYMYLRPLTQYTNCMWYGTDSYETTGEVSGQNGIQDYYYLSSSDGSCYNFWCANYDVITKCNVAMTRGESISLSESTRSVRTAEMLTLRSYAYFNLVETFGGVPLLLKEITAPVYQFTRNTEEEVYTQIVSDLETAIASLPTSLAATDFGRIDKGMAEHLLGKILLTRSYKTFAKSTDVTTAISYFKDVISLHPMVANWDILFNAQSGGTYSYNNSEVLLSVRFAAGYNSLYGSGRYEQFHFPLNLFPGNTHRGAPYWRADPAYQPTLDLIQSYENKDTRASETYLIRNVIAGSAGSANGVSFAKGDTIIYFPTTEMTDAQKTAYMAQHPTIYLVVNPSEYHKLQILGGNSNCYPMVYKFYDPYINSQGIYAASVSDGEDGQGTRDIYLFRTAETKLLLAEAYLKNNDAVNALIQVNDIRNRVNATPLTSVDLDAVLDESGRELFGESNRWMDLKRCGKLFERAFKHNLYVQLNHTSLSDFKQEYLLRPIPLTEEQRTNNSLTQNPGYDE